jgi:hypothetical protein
MKKVLLLAILCGFIFTTSSFALVRLGVKGGVNFANVNADFPAQVVKPDFKTRTGFLAGVSAEVDIPMTNFGIRGDLLYTQKGTKYTVMNEDVKINEDEMVLAPFVVFYLPLPKIKPFIQAGPELGINVRDNVKVGNESTDSGGHWKTTNAGLNVGAGVLLPLGVNELSVDMRYNLGLSNMGTWATGNGGDIKTKTNGVQLLVGFNFFRI